jgi:hypothetical protein
MHMFVDESERRGYRLIATTVELSALWVSDAVAWCHGAGGDWLRRIAPLVVSTTALDP